MEIKQYWKKLRQYLESVDKRKVRKVKNIATEEKTDI